MAQYGIFNDEGCIEAGFYSEAKAQETVADTYADEPHVYVAEMCIEHDEQPSRTCEECLAE